MVTVRSKAFATRVLRCAVTALIRKGTLHVANVGDSRAIIGEERNGKLIAYPLSSDQTCARCAVGTSEPDGWPSEHTARQMLRRALRSARAHHLLRFWAVVG